MEGQACCLAETGEPDQRVITASEEDRDGDVHEGEDAGPVCDVG